MLRNLINNYMIVLYVPYNTCVKLLLNITFRLYVDNCTIMMKLKKLIFFTKTHQVNNKLTIISILPSTLTIVHIFAF